MYGLFVPEFVKSENRFISSSPSNNMDMHAALTARLSRIYPPKFKGPEFIWIPPTNIKAIIHLLFVIIKINGINQGKQKAYVFILHADYIFNRSLIWVYADITCLSWYNYSAMNACQLPRYRTMKGKILSGLEWAIPEHEQFTLQCFAPLRPGKITSVKEQSCGHKR